jgi:hypothetical protein
MQAPMMSDNGQTRVAVLGTLAEFHNQAIPFDMSGLLELVANVDPDLLCLDITPKQWRERDFDKLPPEYREALLPLAGQTDIVVAPIGGETTPRSQEMGGWRLGAINRLRSWISAIQRVAPGPEATNQGWRHDLVNFLYDAIRWLTSSDIKRETWAHVDYLTQEVLAISRRDPGTRMLVVVNVQYCHIIRGRLQKYNEVKVTSFTDL